MSITMMIVDDSAISRARIAKLTARGSAPSIEIVAQANDGEEALLLGKMHQPALVTMDLTMPRLDGVSCIRRLVEFLPETRILVISALSAKSVALAAIKAGAHGFLYKPFTDEQFHEWLAEVVA